MASTTARRSDLRNFRLPLDEVGYTEFRLRLEHAWVVSSRNCFAEVSFPRSVNPSRSSWSSSIMMFRTISFCHLFVSATLRRAVCGEWGPGTPTTNCATPRSLATCFMVLDTGMWTSLVMRTPSSSSTVFHHAIVCFTVSPMGTCAIATDELEEAVHQSADVFGKRVIVCLSVSS